VNTRRRPASTAETHSLTRATLKIIASANGCTDTPRPPTWNAIDLHSIESPPSAARNFSGQLEVFGLSGGIAVHAWQPEPGAGEWGHDSTDLGSPELAANVGATIAALGYGLFF